MGKNQLTLQTHNITQHETSIQTTHDLVQNNTLENNNTNSFNNISPNTSNDLRIFIPINENPCALLFLQANSIYMLAARTQHMYEAFDKNARVTKKYDIASSWFIMFLELDLFVTKLPENEALIVKQELYSLYIEHSLKLLIFQKICLIYCLNLVFLNLINLVKFTDSN